MHNGQDSLTESFTHLLVADVTDAGLRLDSEPSAMNRRHLIRAIFSAIEGLRWQLKQDVISHTSSLRMQLSPHEHAALAEETYQVDDRGKITVQPRFLPLKSSLRLLARVVHRYSDGYEVDFSHPGWQCLCDAIDVRHRITHPKECLDLEVSEEETRTAMRGFYWLLAVVIQVLREHKANLLSLLPQETADSMKQIFDSERSQDSSMPPS